MIEARFSSLRGRSRAAVPAFYLYGEPHSEVADGFVHAEPLAARSRPSHWTIRAHTHMALCHVIHIERGGGLMSGDDAPAAFRAPCLLMIPARRVHAFEWKAESSGTVVTLSSSFLDELARREAQFQRLFAACTPIRLSDAEHREAKRCVARLVRELNEKLSGQGVAVEACLVGLLLLALRRLDSQGSPEPVRSQRQIALVARLRTRLETRFRLREPIATIASHLGVSAGRLRAACMQVEGRPPSAIRDAYVLLEAKRALRYTGLSISEIARFLGFDDAAYFSRFFRQHQRSSPRQFRGERPVRV